VKRLHHDRVEVAGDRLPTRYRRQLEGFRYGPGVFKMDWALSGPIPWLDAATARAGTVHLGGTLEEIAAARSISSRTVKRYWRDGVSPKSGK
jgi:phytoene dehydrogenase-like protein